MTKYDALIIDDEISSLNIIKHFVSKYCLNINIVGEATTVESGIYSIKKHQPQILFLDIQLNDKNAFDILDAIDFSEMEIIFITAYDSYALKAFKYNAVDYVLKPISIEDLVLATNKTINRIEERKVFEKSILKEIKVKSTISSHSITISSIDKVTIINKKDIIFCKSDGRYTTIYLQNKHEIVACKNIGEYEQMLSGSSFFRVHHSYLINTDYLIEINKKAGFYCELINHIKIPIAKRRQEGLNLFLKIKQ